jgi:hypothetical protein
MAMTGATIGKVGWYKEAQPALLNQRVCIFRARTLNSQRFLWHVLNAAFYAEHIGLAAVGGAQPNISDSVLLECAVPVPPPVEQEAIAAFLDAKLAAFFTLTTEAQRAIDLLQERRTALISAHEPAQRNRVRDRHLQPSGRAWLAVCARHRGDASGYDTPRAICTRRPAGLGAGHPAQAWEALTKNHGAAAEAMLLDRLRKQLDDRGTLDVLRRGMEMLGLRQPAEAGPVQARAGHEPGFAGPLRRQPVARGAAGAHSGTMTTLDLVLFLNGIPVATAELKTDFTQDINAVDQYRFDRIPRPRARPFAEPLLDFPRGRWCTSP